MLHCERAARLDGSWLWERFFPRNRIARGLVNSGPWIDMALLTVLFVLVGSKIILQPGVVVALPEAPFTGGARFGMMAVVLSVDGASPGVREEIVFFDDERFRMRDDIQVEKLRDVFARAAKDMEDGGLILQADQRVRHGTIVLLMDMAMDVGIQKVNVAQKPR